MTLKQASLSTMFRKHYKKMSKNTIEKKKIKIRHTSDTLPYLLR